MVPHDVTVMAEAGGGLVHWEAAAAQNYGTIRGDDNAQTAK